MIKRILAATTLFAAMQVYAVDISIVDVSTANETAIATGGVAQWDMHQGIYLDQEDRLFELCSGSLGAISSAAFSHYTQADGASGDSGGFGSYDVLVTFEASQPVNTIFKMCLTSEIKAVVMGDIKLIDEDASGTCFSSASGGLAQSAQILTYLGGPGAVGVVSSGIVHFEFFVPVNLLYSNSTVGTTRLPAMGVTGTFQSWDDLEIIWTYPTMAGECLQQLEDVGRISNGRAPKLPPPDHSGPFEKDFRGMAAFAEWRTPNTTTIVGHGLITELGNGDLPIGCEGDGTYDLSIKPRGCLRMTNEVTVSSISLTLPQLDFIRGDIDEDNYIGTDDYIVLSDYFDKTDEDADWFLSSADHVASPYDADINADGSVGTDDYLIMSDNWDLAGDN